MKQANIISYLSIIIGGAIAIYANANEKQNVYLLILGIFMLMFGAFRLNSKLSSKVKDKKEKNYFTGEEE
ncbi:hypothetical protein [Lacinutrix sp. 5H-3-7-4]|uniref:hypothetical protein n=1 Tax=Lacinutrix sp. (strain 5H-3-7-4) TaxID=983544 RepID=UPI00020A339A|nr:hypothetical protein [Lacinutrix sp. 5H-3-7-4]AEH02579.1 hypothetical protein Lacal_2740 [Lacinutrix sp. 5H-3-7-4]